MAIRKRPTRAERDTEFEAFAAAAVPTLHRSAWLLCRHNHEADDILGNPEAAAPGGQRRP